MTGDTNKFWSITGLLEFPAYAFGWICANSGHIEGHVIAGLTILVLILKVRWHLQHRRAPRLQEEIDED